MNFERRISTYGLCWALSGMTPRHSPGRERAEITKMVGVKVAKRGERERAEIMGMAGVKVAKRGERESGDHGDGGSKGREPYCHRRCALCCIPSYFLRHLPVPCRGCHTSGREGLTLGMMEASRWGGSLRLITQSDGGISTTHKRTY